MSADAPDFFTGKRLVIFGAGYIGTELARQVRARGAEVVGVTRNVERAAELQAVGARAVVGRLQEPAEWRPQLPEAVELVVNCVSSGGGGLDGYRESYVAGFEALLPWAQERARASHLVYTSSTSVYPQEGGVEVTEEAPTGGEERAQVLLQAEQRARSWPGPWTVLRLAGIYGPQRHHVLDQVRTGAAELPGRGDHRLNLIHREDAVAAILNALEQPAWAQGQVFNVCDHEAVRKRELVAHLAAVLGQPEPSFSGISHSSRRASPPDRVISNAKLCQRLGWRPRYPSWRDGYRALLEA